MFERLCEEFAGDIVAIDCGTDADRFRELLEQLGERCLAHAEGIIENWRRGVDYAISIGMPEAGKPGRPKWDGWCETDWYRENGYTVLDYESIFEAAQVFTPPQIPLWEDTT